MAVPDFRGGRSKALRWAAAVLAIAAVAAVIVWTTLPKRGVMTVTALAAGGRSVGRVQVAVDGEPRCEGAPCTIGDLTIGDHVIRVTSQEFGNGERVVSIRSGIDHSVDVLLEQPHQTPPSAASLASVSSASAPVAPSPVAAGQSARERNAPASPPAKPEKRAEARSGSGTIKANSIPVSKVLIDGRAAGQTPANIKVAPGSHTVTFVHPDYGKREVMVEVKARQDAVVAVKLKAGR